MLRAFWGERTALLDKVENLTAGTIQMWNRMKVGKLPTPSKFHYVFNMRDGSRVFQGVLFSPAEEVLKAKETVIFLWLTRV